MSEIGNADFRDLGMRIRQQRIKLDWTQADLAKRIGVTGSLHRPHRTGGEDRVGGDDGGAERGAGRIAGLPGLWDQAALRAGGVPAVQ